MRKIVSKHEADKKRRRNQLIAGGILILVMFLSVAGYAFQNSALSGNAISSNSTTVTYNGLNFVNQNGFWVLESQNTRLVFSYNPSEIQTSNLINLTKTIQDFQGEPLYIYSNNTNAESEINFNMDNFASGVNLLAGNATPDCSRNSIIIENGTSSVTENQNCIYISGQGEGLIKLIDNVLFKLLGIRG